jgi:hypothetical protein
VKLVNLTPHDINVYGGRSSAGDPVFTVPKSGIVARVTHIELGTRYDERNEIAIEMVQYGHLENLPPVRPDTMYIVSLMCALAARGRDDVLAPYQEVRNGAGTMIGCRYFQKVC